MAWSLNILKNSNWLQMLGSLQSRYSEENRVESESDQESNTHVDSENKLVLPEEYRKRWDLTPGTEFLVQETPEGCRLIEL